MAISFGRSGDRWNLQQSAVPKQYVASRWVGGAAGVPAVGMLLKQDTTASFNDGVVQCVDDDVPQYYLLSINSTSGILTCLRLPKLLSMVMEHESATSPTLGHQIVAAGTPGTIPVEGILRDQVQDIASGGIGTIVEITAGALPQLIVVEFGN